MSAPTDAAALVPQLAASLGTGGTAVVLDLEPTLGVCIAADFNRRRIAHAVLVLPRWPYADAILPVEELLGALTSQARSLSTKDPLPNVVFVLDAERIQRVPNRSADDRRTDNRYQLVAADLPNLAHLQERGIRRIVKVAQP